MGTTFTKRYVNHLRKAASDEGMVVEIVDTVDEDYDLQPTIYGRQIPKFLFKNPEHFERSHGGGRPTLLFREIRANLSLDLLTRPCSDRSTPRYPKQIIGGASQGDW